MALFSNILEKLGFKKKEEVKPAAAAAPAKPAPTSGAVQSILKSGGAKEAIEKMAAHNPAAAAREWGTKPMEMVDVMAKLDGMAKANPQKLDWKVSIVDLLKLLDIDSSFESRKELAEELGCPPELMKESQNMNVWLHKTVLAKIAANGGNIPKELLD